MYFNRFDIVEAHYLFYCEYHSGQWCHLYRRLSRIIRYYRPSPLLSVESISDNAREIYENLVRKHKESNG